MKIQLEPLRGFRDLLPPDSEQLTYLANLFARIARRYGYREVKPPTLERFELFAVKSGEEIRNSMFTFRDKSGREVALRPEATASVARIYLRHLRGKPKPIRLYYIVNCFRYENPQRARYREFWQAGVELIGGEAPFYDVEVVKLLADYVEAVGLAGKARLKIGHTGLYRALFNRYGVEEEKQNHILHLMDKKMYDKALEEIRANAPPQLAAVVSKLWEAPQNLQAALEAVEEVKEARKAVEELIYLDRALKSYGIGLPYYFDLSFARGLAYYTGIIFEVEVEGFGFSVAGGGRYDKLISIYGGEDVPSTGFAVGLDRVHYVLTEIGLELPVEQPKARVAVVPLSPELLGYALRVQDELLEVEGVEAVLHVGDKLSKLIPRLLDQGYTHVAIIGEREAAKGTVSLRDLRARKQVEVELSKLNELVLGGL